jgi:hypothetical protein
VSRGAVLLVLLASVGACGASPRATSVPGDASGGADGSSGGSDVAPSGTPDVAGDAAPSSEDLAPSSDAAQSDTAPPRDAPTASDATSSIDAPTAGGIDAPAADAARAETGATDAGWPNVADYGAPGPFPVTRDKNTGPGAAYDVFRPTTLGAAGLRHPIVSWANGTLFSLDQYQMLLTHWASHGFVVIAGHTNTTAGGGTHKAGIDWLVAEDARAGSAYLGVLDTKHVGAAGHSQGGGATIAAGANKPGPLGLTTTLPLMPILSFESDKTIVSKQTAPMFNINATMDTRDPTGAVADAIYSGANEELVQAAFIGIHEDAMGPAMLAPTLAWLRLRLMGDAAARTPFYPAGTCGLCQDKAWKTVRSKNVP